MGTCAAWGALGKLLVQGGNNPRTFSGTSERYSFVYEGLSSTRNQIGKNSIQGSRSRTGNRVAKESYQIGGPIMLQLGPDELELWLPRILGGTKSGSNFDPAETLPTFDVLVHRDNGIWKYTDCQVDKAVFRCRSGPGGGDSEIVETVVLLQAMTELDGQSWPGSEPAVPSGAGYIPYTIAQAALSLNSTSFSFDTFNLMIDNQLIVRNRNSLTPTCIFPGGRMVGLQIQLPFISGSWTVAEALYDTGAAGSITLTAGARSCTFSFPDLRNAQETPNIPGKTEIPLQLNLEAFRTSSLPEIRVTTA